MATMCTVDIVDMTNGNVAVHLFNFGSPRVGDKVFVDWVQQHVVKMSNGSVFRMRRQKDIVPSIPPRSIGYAHVATEIWDEHTSNDAMPDTYRACDGTGEDPTCGDSEEHPPFPLYLLHLKPSEHTMYMGFQGGSCVGGE